MGDVGDAGRDGESTDSDSDHPDDPDDSGSRPGGPPPDADVEADGDAPGPGARSDGDDGESASRRSPPDLSVDRDRIADHVDRRAEAIRRREVETALRKLDERGDLTDAQREAVEEMAAGIVEELMASPKRALREADPDTLAAAMRVYGVDPSDYVPGGGGADGRDDSADGPPDGAGPSDGDDP